MPFKSPEEAILYLKAAEVISGSPCGIYELIYSRGENRYRIFPDDGKLLQAALSGKNIRCENREPLYRSRSPSSAGTVFYPSPDEIVQYMQERKDKGIID
ncbi:hypothetical protein K7I13_02695 [Brucepastera parasyntrophica]|uniref:hypothetical protein n=1 Tax=Brucepastera parasyntrophica TaxID=2880008 RepID=UPI00210C1EBB|nr:hypothetical protein [Brucepastera parasyntrophica]ULQ60238.1 hypothetical protein K7I13_02695 [Brucepastera parasyntrophica]